VGYKKVELGDGVLRASVCASDQLGVSDPSAVEPFAVISVPLRAGN
jgi:hypothetical protein